MLLLLPVEVLSLIVQFTIELESFKVVGKLKGLCRYFNRVISTDASLLRCIDLSRLRLKDSHFISLLSGISLRFIRQVSFVGNREVTHQSIRFIIQNMQSIEKIDIQDTLKVDLFLLLVDLKSCLEFSSLQTLNVLHSGQGKRYICRVSIENLVLEEKQEILDVVRDLELFLKEFNREFMLEPGICLECLEEMSIEFTPQCRKCKKWVKRSCGKCQSRNYRICIECLYTLCHECDYRSKGFFVFPNCCLEICYEHHGRVELLRNLAVCGTKCKAFKGNSCYNCGFWVCPRTRECHYEMGVLRSINRVVQKCGYCGHGTCGLCKDMQSLSKRCFSCKSQCFHCLEKGWECSFPKCRFTICKGCLEKGLKAYVHPHTWTGEPSKLEF